MDTSQLPHAKPRPAKLARAPHYRAACTCGQSDDWWEWTEFHVGGESVLFGVPPCHEYGFGGRIQRIAAMLENATGTRLIHRNNIIDIMGEHIAHDCWCWLCRPHDRWIQCLRRIESTQPAYSSSYTCYYEEDTVRAIATTFRSVCRWCLEEYAGQRWQHNEFCTEWCVGRFYQESRRQQSRDQKEQRWLRTARNELRRVRRYLRDQKQPSSTGQNHAASKSRQPEFARDTISPA